VDGLSSSCVLYFQCCQCLWIVCLRSVSCVSNAADVSGLFVFVLCLVCPMLLMSLDCLSSSCVLCVQCCQCLWIVCLRLVSCVSNTADVSGLLVFVLCLMCPMLPMSLDCLSSSCFLCDQYCRFLSIVCLRPVSCVSNTADVSGLFVFVLCLACPMLPMSLVC
jgi:cbb3-type cytochrome oxidase subunit 3